MGTIFVAYGDKEGRFDVLEFAISQSASSDHDLYVYHVLESSEASASRVRREIEHAVDRMDPFVVYDLEIDEMADRTTESRGTKSQQLVDAISHSTRDYEYVVMGEIERGPIEGIRHSSMTTAVLKERKIPVMLVPV